MVQTLAAFLLIASHPRYPAPSEQHVDIFTHACSDTSRSGWKAVDDGTPIDNRKARGNWCNVNGAGLGERPRVSPVASLPIIDVRDSALRDTCS